MSFKLLHSLAIAACAGVSLLASPAFADDASSGPSPREACAADFAKFCAGQDPRSDTGRACLREHRADFSEPCRTAMQARRQEMMDKIKTACSADVAKFCTSGSPTGEGTGRCLRDHQAELSDSCKAAFPNHRG